MAKKAKAKKAKKTVKRRTKVRPARIHSIGVLHTGTKDNFRHLVGLMETEANDYLRNHGSTDSIEIHGDGHYADDSLATLKNNARALVDNPAGPVIIVAAGGPQSALAARDATLVTPTPLRNNLPIVFTTVADPEPNGLDLVNNVSRPGRNLTGVAGKTSESDSNRLAVLRAFVWPQRLAPKPTKVGVLINPGRPLHARFYAQLANMARSFRPRLELVPRYAEDESGIALAFQEFRNPGYLGVVVTADSFFNNHRPKVIDEAEPRPGIRPGIPVIYQWRSFVADGGLISFGPSIEDAYKEAGRYVARIRPLGSELPATMECLSPAASSFKIFVKGSTATAVNLNPIVPPITVDGLQYTVNVIP